MSNPTLLVVGKLRPERKRSLTGMAVAAKLSLVAIEEPAEALKWLDSSRPHCLLVDASVKGLEKLIAKVRSKPGGGQVPVLALVQAPDDLFIEQYFGWGGDEIVPAEAGASLLERLRTIAREPPQVCPGRRVIIADPDKARCDVLGRAFSQAGYDVRSAIDRTSLEFLVKQYDPPAVVANSAVGDLPEIISRLRKENRNAGWLILAARRDLDLQQTALSNLERCAVLGLQSSPWQLLYVANGVGRATAIESVAERRKVVRYYVGSQVLFRASGGDDDELGVCYNVSLGGMYVRSMAPPSADEVWLEWRVPQEKSRIRLEGRVVYRQDNLVSPSRLSAPLGFGVEFSDYLGSARIQLENALTSLQEQAAKRSQGSLPVSAAVAAVSSGNLPAAKAVVVAAPARTRAPEPAARTVSLPPRPAGAAVAVPPRPDRPKIPFIPTGRDPARVEAPAVSESTEAPTNAAPEPTPTADVVLGDDASPVSSERTDVVKNPLAAFNLRDSGSMPLEMEDAPTVITKASSPDLLEQLADETARVPPQYPLLPSSVEPPSPSDVLPTERFHPAVLQPELDRKRVSTFARDSVPDLVPRAASARRSRSPLIAGAVLLLLGGFAAVAYKLQSTTTAGSADTTGAKGTSARSGEPPGASRVTGPSRAPGVAPKAPLPSPDASALAAESLVASAGSGGPTPSGGKSEVAYPDPGGDIPGYPPVEEPQAGKGRLLADRYGYLVVRFPEPAFIFFENIAIGPVNAKIATLCGEKTLRIGVGEKPTTFLSEAATVNVPCRETTRVVFRRLPDVVAPPGAMRPIPNGSLPKRARGGSEEPESQISGSRGSDGDTPKAQAPEAESEPAPKPTANDLGAVDTRQ